MWQSLAALVSTLSPRLQGLAGQLGENSKNRPKKALGTGAVTENKAHLILGREYLEQPTMDTAVDAAPIPESQPPPTPSLTTSSVGAALPGITP